MLIGIVALQEVALQEVDCVWFPTHLQLQNLFFEEFFPVLVSREHSPSYTEIDTQKACGHKGHRDTVCVNKDGTVMA